VPPAIVRSIRAAGITAMEIHRSGNRLAMMMENRRRLRSRGQGRGGCGRSEVVAWEALMGRFQRALPWAGPGEKWVEARRIFALDEQGEGR
jgi:L-rhamnose mutarotase